MRTILFIVTSHENFDSAGKKTGLWLEEYAIPFQIFQKNVFRVVTASPKGGAAPIDPVSMQGIPTPPDDVFEALKHTVTLRNLSSLDYDAVFYPGGHGPLWDLSTDLDNRSLLEDFIHSGKYVAAVCHGPAGLLAAREKNGTPYLSGKNVTGFSNAEEKAVNLDRLVPFLLEDRMRAEGAQYSAAAPGKEYVCEDGTLITGQNPASSRAVAKHLIYRLKSK